MTAQQVVDQIQKNLGTPWKDSGIDSFGAGHPDTAVTGIATSFAPSLKVLRQAAASNRNMIIAREHVFYNHGGAPTLEKPEEDPACAAKQDFITRHKLVVWRFSENWDRQKVDRQMRALAKAVGWEQRQIRGEFFALPVDSLENVASGIRRRLKISGVRVIGNPKIEVAKVALSHGMMLVSQLGKILQEPGLDAVVIGESAEWEAVPYFQDLVASGRKQGMIVIGQAASEDPGCGEMADWLKTILHSVSIEWLPVGDPFWTPERRPA